MIAVEQRAFGLFGLVLAGTCVLWSCQSHVADGDSAVESNKVEQLMFADEILGDWVVTSWNQPGVAALSAEEADSFLGSTLRVEPSRMSFAGHVIEAKVIQTRIRDLEAAYEFCQTNGGANCNDVAAWHGAASVCTDSSGHDVDSFQLVVALDDRGRQIAGPSELLFTAEALVVSLEGTYFCLHRK